MDRRHAIEALLDKQEITEALARYCRGVDRRDAELVRSAYHADATDDHGYTPVERGWEIADLSDRDNPEGFPREWTSTTHQISNVLIELDGDRAASETYYVATMRFAHEGTDYELVVSGRYVDRWERRDGAFRIADRIVVHDFVKTEAVEGTWPGPDTGVPKGFYGAPPIPPEAVAVWGTATADDVSYPAFAEMGSSVLR